MSPKRNVPSEKRILDGYGNDSSIVCPVPKDGNLNDCLETIVSTEKTKKNLNAAKVHGEPLILAISII